MPIPEYAQPENVEELVNALTAAMKKLGPELNALNRMTSNGNEVLLLSARFLARVDGRDVTATCGPDYAPRRVFVAAADDMSDRLRSAIESLAVMRDQARTVLALEREAHQVLHQQKLSRWRQQSARALRHSTLS